MKCYVTFQLFLFLCVGLSTLDEVASGVQEILADMIAKDKDTLTYVQSLWDTLANPIFSAALQSLLIIIFRLCINLIY